MDTTRKSRFIWSLILTVGSASVTLGITNMAENGITGLRVGILIINIIMVVGGIVKVSTTD